MQCFCFLATKDHFSSSGTSWVVGGKSHQLVVSGVGVVAGPQGVAHDGVFIDARQACGLADAAAILKVLKDGQSLRVVEAAAKESRALALGEAVLAGAAGEHAALPAGAVAEADAEVVAAAEAIIGAVGVLAAEEAKVVHARDPKQCKVTVAEGYRSP